MTRSICTRAAAMILLTTGAATGDTLTLNTGETLRNVTVAQDEGVYVVEHPVLGTLNIPVDAVAQVGPDAAAAPPTPDGDAPPVPVTTPVAAAPTPEEVEEGEAAPDVRPGLFGTGFMRGWERSISLGLSGADGNTEELDLNAGFTAGYEDEHDRWAVELAYMLGSEDGERTDHEFYAQVQKDWLIPDSRWFYFAEARYDWDEFEAWDHRVSAGGGVGYEFLQRDDLWLRGRAGLGLSKEFGSEDDDIVPEAILGLNFGWKPADNQEITASNTFYPALNEWGEFRNITTAAWQIAIDRDYGLSLKLGLENEYESETEDDSFHNDLTYFAAIVYDF